MPAAHFLGLRPGLVLAQHPDDLLLAKATPFHRPSPFQATDSTSFRLSFRGAGQPLLEEDTHSFWPEGEQMLEPLRCGGSALMPIVSPSRRGICPGSDSASTNFTTSWFLVRRQRIKGDGNHSLIQTLATYRTNRALDVSPRLDTFQLRLTQV